MSFFSPSAAWLFLLALPLVALYFAVMKNSRRPGFVFAFKDGFNDLGTAGRVAEQGDTFLDVFRIDGNDGLPYCPNDDTINLMRPPVENARSHAQKGLFVWNRGIDCRLRPGWLIFQIPSEQKAPIMSLLAEKGIDENSLRLRD